MASWRASGSKSQLKPVKQGSFGQPVGQLPGAKPMSETISDLSLTLRTLCAFPYSLGLKEMLFFYVADFLDY